MAGIKRTKWTEDDTPPEWEEQYRDVDEEPTYTPSDPSWTEDNDFSDNNRSWEITRERVDTPHRKEYEEYADPEWSGSGRDDEWSGSGRDDEWSETGADPEWPEDKQEFWQDTGNQDTDDWMNVDIYEDRYPEEEVNQEKAAVRRKR